jgi:hypothetical protein
MLDPFEQPKWFKDLKPTAGQLLNQKAAAVEQLVAKASVEDRVTALEALLELHGIRPK